jgi:hypothetical protein
MYIISERTYRKCRIAIEIVAGRRINEDGARIDDCKFGQSYMENFRRFWRKPGGLESKDELVCGNLFLVSF